MFDNENNNENIGFYDIEQEQERKEVTLKTIPQSAKLNIPTNINPNYNIVFTDTGEYVNAATMIFLGTWDIYRHENPDKSFTLPSLTRAYRPRRELISKENSKRQYKAPTPTQIKNTHTLLNSLRGRKIKITVESENGNKLEYEGEALNYDEIKITANGIMTTGYYMRTNSIIAEFAREYHLEIPTYKYRDLCLPTNINSTDISISINLAIQNAINNREKTIYLKTIYTAANAIDKKEKYKARLISEKVLTDKEDSGYISGFLCGKDGEPISSRDYTEYIISY